MRWASMVWACLVLALVGVEAAGACNEVVCASMVSRWILTLACRCDLTNSANNNCTCCRDCAKCLGYLYSECCSCLGTCEPRSQVMEKIDSQVGDLAEPFPQLFQALTAEKDPMLRWTSMEFPIDSNDLDKSKYKLVVHPQDTAQVDQVTVNCTVLYMSQCVSGSRCKDTCKSMGAAAYRWFFDGCCECVGTQCINYGVNESRCIQCPMVNKENHDDILTDQHQANNSADNFDEAAAQGDGAAKGDPNL